MHIVIWEHYPNELLTPDEIVARMGYGDRQNELQTVELLGELGHGNVVVYEAYGTL